MSILHSGLVTVFDSRTWKSRTVREEILALPVWQPEAQRPRETKVLKLLPTCSYCVEDESHLRSKRECYGQMACVLGGLVLCWMPACSVDIDAVGRTVDVRISPLRSKTRDRYKEARVNRFLIEDNLSCQAFRYGLGKNCCNSLLTLSLSDTQRPRHNRKVSTFGRKQRVEKGLCNEQQRLFFIRSLPPPLHNALWRMHWSDINSTLSYPGQF